MSNYENNADLRILDEIVFEPNYDHGIRKPASSQEAHDESVRILEETVLDVRPRYDQGLRILEETVIDLKDSEQPK